MFSLLKIGCHGNGAIARFVQLFGSSIMQFLNPEILTFHLMYDAAWSTAGHGWGPSPNLVICCYTNSCKQSVGCGRHPRKGTTTGVGEGTHIGIQRCGGDESQGGGSFLHVHPGMGS